MIFNPSRQKGKNRKNSETQPLRDKADTTFHYDDKDYIDDSRCGVAHAGMKRLTRHEQMVFIFGRDLVNSGMESGGNPVRFSEERLRENTQRTLPEQWKNS